MCGIAGVWSPDEGYTEQQLTQFATNMADAIFHRGPDGEGVYVQERDGLALSHRRLAIIDLSPHGKQPMVSSSGRYVISYNGEIYNAPELQSQLAELGVRFRGHSDTEVLLEAIAAWGVEKASKLVNGIFAFAVWDRDEKCLWLVRDRMGVKPLYYTRMGGSLLFGSELKALWSHPDWRGILDHGAIASYLRHGYIQAPSTIFSEVRKLPPASLIRFSNDASVAHSGKYWSLEEVALSGSRNPISYTVEQAKQELDALLTDAIGRQMVSDVPLGAFLSGGIDSSIVVAMMQKNSSKPIRSFSIGFNEDGYNEAQHAKAVAQHLGTDHTELYVTPEEALDVIPKLPSLYDEPFADSSQIPTFLVSQMTKANVTVALSGDGGDELFAGYTRYFYANMLAEGFEAWPRAAKNLLALALQLPPDLFWRMLGRLLPSLGRGSGVVGKKGRLVEILKRDPADIYRSLLSLWPEPSNLLRSRAEETKGILWARSYDRLFPNDMSRMQFLDMMTYLPDDILTKVDRASMGVALEARVPLLDHRIAEFAWQLPLDIKVRDGEGKWLLKQVLYDYVPRATIDRPKMGFGVPVGDWIRDPLKDWAESLISSGSLDKHGVFEAEPIWEKWRQHQNSEQNWQYWLWPILVMQAWLDEAGPHIHSTDFAARSGNGIDERPI